MKVLVTDSDLPRDGRMEQVLLAAGHSVDVAACRSEDDVLAVGQDADALVVQWAPITDRVLAGLPRCRFVSRLGIGYDMVDVQAATRRGIAVANTPDYCIEEVATHTVALALHGLRDLGALDRSVRAGEWSAIAAAPRAVRPSVTSALVVGFGRIGARVASMLRCLGFTVLVHDPYVNAALVDAVGATAVTLDDGLGQASVVTLHAPLTDATHELLDERAFALCRPGTWIVNTCRGGLIDESALVRALASGHLGGAALDVFVTEPLPVDSPLRHAPNVLLTPHAAWYSPESLADLPIRAAENVVDFLSGRRVDSVVNPGHASPPAAV